MMDSKEETALQTSEIQHINKGKVDAAHRNLTEHPADNCQGNVVQKNLSIEDSKSTEKVVRSETDDTCSSSGQKSSEGTQPVFPETQLKEAQLKETSDEEQTSLKVPLLSQETHKGFQIKEEPAPAPLAPAKELPKSSSPREQPVRDPLTSWHSASEPQQQSAGHHGSTAENQTQENEQGDGKGKASERAAAPGSGWPEERVGRIVLFGVPIVSLHVEGQERLCLAQISASLLHVRTVVFVSFLV